MEPERAGRSAGCLEAKSGREKSTDAGAQEG